MTSEKMYGVFEYQEKEYPFVLEEQIITIPQVPFQYMDDFKDDAYIEEIWGVTNNNRSVVFVGCQVLKSNRIAFAMEVKLSILGYVVLENDKSSFDRIDFYSEGINGFYSPRNAYQIEDDDHMRVTGIKPRDAEAYKRDYECVIHGEGIQLGLNVYMSFNLAFEKKLLGTAESLLSMSFGEKKEPHDILKYSLYLMDFLEFVNFQKNIPLERIDLFEKDDNGKYQRRGRAIVFQAENEQYSPSALRSITLLDVTDECFPVLFGQIAERRESKRFNPFFYPESRRADRVIDASKWLNNAICFEGEFDDAFPNYKAQNDPAFYEAKMRLLMTIESAVKQTGRSINNKQNTAWKSFKRLIERADTTLKEKFEACQMVYEAETRESIQRICRACGIPEGTDLAEAYASFRNQTAHGEIQSPGNVEIATYQILRCFVYVMNLRRAGVPQEKIKEVLKRMF